MKLHLYLTVGLVALTLFAASVGCARASIIVDTIGNDTYKGFDPNGWSVGQEQSIAMPFSWPTAVTITGIDAFIGASGSIVIGIMKDAAGLPSGSFLYSAAVPLDLNNPIQLGLLSWDLEGGSTYWLAAIAEGEASWGANFALQGPFAFTFGGSWFAANDTVPEARITGIANSVPEPSTWVMMFVGFAVLGLLAFRRRKDLTLAA